MLKGYWDNNKDRAWKWVSRWTFSRRVFLLKRDIDKALLLDNQGHWWARNLKYWIYNLKREYKELASEWKAEVSYAQFAKNRRSRDKEEAIKRIYKVRPKKWI